MNTKTVSTSTDGTNWTFANNFRFLYDGWNLIAEYSASEATSTSLTLQASHAWGIDLSGTPQGAGGVGGLLSSTLISQSPNPNVSSFFPSYDGNGNISAWCDATGTLLARMDYSPFGQLIALYRFTGDTTLSRLHFGFSTKFTDAESGLLYYGYRYYDPVAGRWPSRDPIEEEGGLNLYGFVGNIPTSRIDYLGMVGFDSFKKTIDNICRGQEKKLQHWTVWNDQVRASYDETSDKYLITKEYGILDIEHFLTGANVALKNKEFTAKIYVYGGKYTDGHFQKPHFLKRPVSKPLKNLGSSTEIGKYGRSRT